jgi:hypothetical protein
MYKVGSRPDMVLKSEEGEFQIVDDYSGVTGDEKPHLIFGKSDSVMDDEGKCQ